MGYRYLFTIQTPITPHLPEALWARRRFRDLEPDFEAMAFADKFRPENREAEMRIVRGFSESYYFRERSGQWHLKPAIRSGFERVAKAAFPDYLKGRTLIMLSRNNPYYVRLLPADDLMRENAAYRDAAQAWRNAGYESTDYGSDYEASDYGDRTHLSASGGRRLANKVADKVLEISRKRGYLQGEPPRP